MAYIYLADSLCLERSLNTSRVDPQPPKSKSGTSGASQSQGMEGQVAQKKVFLPYASQWSKCWRNFWRKVITFRPTPAIGVNCIPFFVSKRWTGAKGSIFRPKWSAGVSWIPSFYSKRSTGTKWTTFRLKLATGQSWILFFLTLSDELV